MYAHIYFAYFALKINSLQNTTDIYNFYAKIQKSSVMTKFILPLPGR